VETANQNQLNETLLFQQQQQQQHTFSAVMTFVSDCIVVAR